MKIFANLYNLIREIVLRAIPEIRYLSCMHEQGNDYVILNTVTDSIISKKARIYSLYHIDRSQIGDYTYIARNSVISMAEIGKFCSIGANFVCGWGIHPINGISTAPMFYSTMKQNGVTLAKENKVVERKPIKIGNDVFIGANVTILDGLKNVPAYAVAVGCPMHILHYRFEENIRKSLLSIKWWEFNDEQLKDVELLFFDVNKFINKYTV